MAAVAAIAPELMTWPLPATESGEISADGLATLPALVRGKTVLAIGPGLGQNPQTIEFLSRLLLTTQMPAVLDADALNILSAERGLLDELSAMAKAGRTVVFTPHPGEMARLTGIPISEIQANRLKIAREFAQRLGVTLVLKGARTLIAHPDGQVAINTTGNPAMAKGGSGDLLTGLVAGLLAQYPLHPTRAVEAAVHLHGLAADLAVRHADEHTVLPTDTLVPLSQAFRFPMRGSTGYVWLQGAMQPAAPYEVRG
jgi:NAD(P)H-hydrate epimerase